MIDMDWTNMGYDVLSMVVTFIIITLIAYIALWILDKGTPMIPFESIRDNPLATAIASLGWMIIYSLAFAGSLIAPYSLDVIIIREIIWTFVMVIVACALTLVAVRILSPLSRYCTKEGLDCIGKESMSVSIFYLGICILVGVISYTALVA